MVLLTGLGLVADSTLRAGPVENPPTPAKPIAAKPADPAPATVPEDAVFLRRTSLDLRGTLPSLIEMTYFLADSDIKKRKKIVEWMLPEHGKRKASKACQSCHTGVAFTDVDQDGFLDVLITSRKWMDEIYNPNSVTVPGKESINLYADFTKMVTRHRHRHDDADVKPPPALGRQCVLTQRRANQARGRKDAEVEKAAKAQMARPSKSKGRRGSHSEI